MVLAGGREREGNCFTSCWGIGPQRASADTKAAAAAADDGAAADDAAPRLEECAAQRSAALPSVLRKIVKWGDYECFGTPLGIPGAERLIPMKSPLTPDHTERIGAARGLPVRRPHSLTSFLAFQRSAGRKVRLIIDLTCHDCLYESELVGAPVRYLQLATPAKQFVDRALIHRIAREITELWASEPDAYVAMHCSYGFNRTGFVIVSYLVEFGGLDIEEALAIFEQSRPPGVKHENFLAELRRRYGAPSSADVRAQSVPQRVPRQRASLSDEPSSLSTTPVTGEDFAQDGPKRRNSLLAHLERELSEAQLPRDDETAPNGRE